MTLADLLRFAGAALLGHRLRSGLCLLGVAIGVAAVVLLTALGEGARRYVVGQFESLGTNIVVVIPGKTETTGGIPGIGGAPNDLTLSDAEALRQGLPSARRVVPIVLGNETVRSGDRSRQVAIVGTSHEWLAVRRLGMRAGEFLPPLEGERSKPVAVLGPTLAREVFPGENPLGRVARIGQWRVRVIGVLETTGEQLGIDLGDLAVVPVGTALRMFDRSSLFRIVLEGRSEADLPGIQRRAVEILTARHGEEDVTVLTEDAVIESLSGIISAITAALGAIAAVSLAVAGVGIMNVLLVSVSERTAEVGLLKALGATRRQVLAVFLAEAVLLAGAGGAVGLAASWLLTRVVVWLYPVVPVAPPAWAVAAALGLAVTCGVVFGVLPAARATRLDPVAALARGG